MKAVGAHGKEGKMSKGKFLIEIGFSGRHNQFQKIENQNPQTFHSINLCRVDF
jgi:hypothetical protein